MEAISVVVRIQSPRHFSWPMIITPDLWGWILWIFLIKFKFKEGISLFLYEILEFHMTTDCWIINIDRPVYKAWGPERNTHKLCPAFNQDLTQKFQPLSCRISPSSQTQPDQHHHLASSIHFLSPKPPAASH